MRRGTLIAIIFLLVILTGAAIYQLRLANQPTQPLPGPTSPNQIPELPS